MGQPHGHQPTTTRDLDFPCEPRLQAGARNPDAAVSFLLPRRGGRSAEPCEQVPPPGALLAPIGMCRRRGVLERRQMAVDESQELVVAQMIAVPHGHLRSALARRPNARVSDFDTEPSEMPSALAMSR